MYREPLEMRFWSKVVKQKNGCWVWTGATNDKGYGSIRVDNYRHRGVHILSYEWYYGEILPGLDIDHICRNRACVNPRHLQVLSHAENVRLIWERNPHVRPTHCSHGHELSGANVTVTGKRWRCRTCARGRTARGRARQAEAPRPVPPRPEQCHHGHVMDDENAIAAYGGWRCRKCQVIASTRYREQYREMPRELPSPPAVCVNGHPMVGDNLERSKTQWVCGECRRANSRRSYHKRMNESGIETRHYSKYAEDEESAAD